MTEQPASEPVYDFIVLGCAPHLDLSEPQHLESLNRLAHRSAMGQYKRQRPRALIMEPIEWLITNKWEDVEAFQPAHDCLTCRTGNDQAVAYLKEHEDRWLALGNMKYWEVW